MNKKLLYFGLIVLLTFTGFFILQKKKKTVKKVHYHAGFQVYLDNKLQDFSKPKYMAIKPCGGEEESEGNEQIEKAHLHDNVGNVVHVEAEGAKWKDLFQNINYKIDDSKSTKAYINGKKADNILEYPIKSYDSMTIFIGKSDLKLLQNAVSKDQILKAEQNAESC